MDVEEFSIGSKRFKWYPSTGHITMLKLATQAWDKITPTADSLADAKAQAKAYLSTASIDGDTDSA